MALVSAGPTIRLVIHGTSAVYLLATPDRPTSGPGPVYDERIHLAYLLALRGHRAAWLAAHLDIPRPAARQIVAYARPAPAPRPLADRAFGVTY
ncbi:hypothetical protein [Streptomyces sp. NPDC087300]|uniref:hypothetical protein n=1 Tax=Streptomyces sp. NPDC087300 TaxID=3365780 RepID=UPI003811393E